MYKLRPLFRGVAAIGGFFLAASCYASNLLEENKIMVDQQLGTKSSIVVTEEDDDSLFKTFVPDDDMMTEDGKLDPVAWDQAHKNAAQALQESGTVLLKNTNNALPLAKTTKVSIFGTRGKNAAFTSGLIGDGKFESNPALVTAYNAIRANPPSPGYANNKSLANKLNPGEISKAQILAQNADIESTFAEYNTAIVVLGRQNAEGADYQKGPDGVADGHDLRNPLAGSKEEKELVEWVSEKFDKVVVMIETVSQMEIGYIKNNPKVQAILYIGLPDRYGSSSKGLYNVLTGEVNPSGGLYDIYSSCVENTPAAVNVGLYEYANKDAVALIQNKALSGRSARVTTDDIKALLAQRDAQGSGRIDTSSIGTGGTDFGFYNYLIEQEGLYVGYRYYETRYEDCVLNQGNAKGAKGIFDSTGGEWKYSQEVDYGFGFGLSYTTFDFEITEPHFEKNGKHEILAKFDVKVKNTGSVAGRTPIQIYSQSPYTSYDKLNGVEKSSIQLVTFEKSGLIQPGETKTYPVIVDLQDVASYDGHNKKTYIMEESPDYYFAVGNGAHDALNNVLALKGKTTSDGMDYNGNNKAAKKWAYTNGAAEEGVDAYTFAYSKTGEKITNQLGKVEWNDFVEGEPIKGLSRQDWQATWPKEQVNLTAPEEMIKLLKGEYFDIKRDAEHRNLSEEEFNAMWGQKTDLKFSDFKLADFNDDRWEELLSGIKFEDALMYAIQSGRGFSAINDIGVPSGSFAENGAGITWKSSNPDEIQAPWKVEKPSTGSYPSSTVGYFNTYAIWASSFDRDVMHEIGRLMGNDAIVGDKPIVWLPGANTHRSAFGGRASQYFCEDPVLTGICTMEVAHGALENGGIITAKHFAFNDQEAGRSGIAPFMTEQRAREVELRAFQIAFEMNKYDTPEEDVGMMGVMTSFSKIGAIECTAHEGLMTNILQKEWGFHGYVVSDLKDDLDIMPETFRAGSTGYDWRTKNVDLDPYYDVEYFKYDKDVVAGIRSAVKRKLWMFAHTPLVNSINKTTHSEWNMTWWRSAYTASIATSASLTGLGVALYAVSLFLKKKGA